jgi:hypothetical protein
MTGQDQQKLHRAGFSIFRMRRDGSDPNAVCSIWVCTHSGGGGWRKHSSYTTLASMKRAWKELMTDEHHISDTAGLPD